VAVLLGSCDLAVKSAVSLLKRGASDGLVAKSVKEAFLMRNDFAFGVVKPRLGSKPSLDRLLSFAFGRHSVNVVVVKNAFLRWPMWRLESWDMDARAH